MARNPVKDIRKDMRKEVGGGGVITEYLAYMRTANAQGAESLEADLVDLFKTDMGLRVLKLFEKSVLLRAVPNGASDCALREHNSLRNFHLELRRIVSNGAET